MRSSSLSASELACHGLNIPVNWLYVQIRQKRLLIDRQPSGAYLFQDSPAVLNAIRSLRDHASNCIDHFKIIGHFTGRGIQHG